jgi:hypothetical protein
MELIRMDIDQLLESTSEEETDSCKMMKIEIDMLLAVTKDW